MIVLDHSVGCLGRLERTINLGTFSQKIEQHKKAEEIQEEININKTISFAEDELLRSKQEPSEKEVDSDWLSRWREHAKGTSNEELHKIWARTLAGEVKSLGLGLSHLKLVASRLKPLLPLFQYLSLFKQAFHFL